MARTRMPSRTSMAAARFTATFNRCRRRDWWLELPQPLALLDRQVSTRPIHRRSDEGDQMRRLLATTLVAAFAIAACSGAAAPTSPPSLPDSSQPPPTAIATAPPSTVATAPVATPSAVPTVTAVEPADGVLFLDGGCTDTLARCQNMAAGTYETS